MRHATTHAGGPRPWSAFEPGYAGSWDPVYMQKLCSEGMLSPKDVLSFHQISLHSIFPLANIGLKYQ